MTATKKSIRFLTVLALIFAMVLSITSTPVSAETTETWYYGSNTESNIPVYGTYITSVKTMGDYAHLTITANFVPQVAFTQIKYTVEIRDDSYVELLASNSSSSALIYCPVTVRYTVQKNSKIRLVFRAYDATTGEPVNATVNYMYSLTR